jgi:hypothetical protein
MDQNKINRFGFPSQKMVLGCVFSLAFFPLLLHVAFSVNTFVDVSEHKGICFRTFKNTDNVTKRHLPLNSCSIFFNLNPNFFEPVSFFA